MSIISVYEVDKSNAMYKRYAFLASGYLNEPDAVNDSTSKIPLENLFRLLEMYKYDAFSDESRTGVLAVKNNRNRVVMRATSLPWQTKVVEALDNAVFVIFENTNKDRAVDELEETLRLLSNKDEMDPARVSRAVGFFNTFIEGLN